MTKDNEDYRELYQYVRWNNTSKVLNILRSNHSINIVEQGLFIVAIESGNLPIVQALLDYFNNYQLSRSEDYHEQLSLKSKMHHFLELAIEDVIISTDMQEILSAYLNFEDTDEQDLSSEDSMLCFSDECENIKIDQSIDFHESESSLTATNLALLDQQYEYYHDVSILGDA